MNQITDISKLDLSALSGLSEEEKKLAISVLNEYIKDGSSETLNKILLEDYAEIPVDIETFIEDDTYLGKGLHLVDESTGYRKQTVFPYWIEMLKKLFPNNIDTSYNTLVLSGAIGLGKAQPLTAKVMTESGFKQMGDLELSDRVYGVDGELHKLIGIFPQGKKKIYKVTFTDGSSTECCDEHLWNIRIENEKNSEKTVELKELINKPLYELNSKKHKESLYYIPMTEPLKFPKKDLFIAPYIIGWLLGNGELSEKQLSSILTDQEVIDRISLEPDKDNQLEQALNLYEEHLKKYKLDVQAEYRFIPEDYLYNDIEGRIALLQGLMDVKGNVNKDGSALQFDTSSEKLKDNIIFLIESLGGSAWYEVTQDNKKSYNITFKLPENICPFNLSEEKDKINPEYINPSRAIDNIEYVGEKECQCIYIDSSDHLYLTDDFIVTHNTLVAVIAMLYMLYRMLCLKDPYKHFGLQPIDHITFSVMNITLDAAKGVAWSKIQELIQASPWFLAHGRLSKSMNPEWQPENNIELIYGSQPRHVIGRAVYCSFEDEVSFQPNSDIEKQKEKARELISSIDARMSSRFMHGEKLPTLHILASSKRTDQSFLETYIDMKKKNESKTTLIIDEPQWVIRTDKDSPNKFAVAIGNKFLESEVLPLTYTEDDYQLYRDKGYSILMVPMGYHEQFLDDINIALTDIAGISTSSSMNYISGVRWTQCRNDKLKNPFTREILEVGNGPEDFTQYYDFFDLSVVDRSMLNKPLFIHLDMSISGDKTGIAGVWIKGKKPHQEGVPDSKELYYQLAFSVSIKAPKGRQISFEKNRQFIYWLKEKGFKIKGISYDTFNSVDLGQALQSKGFNCSIVSVDRTTSAGADTKSKICIPYQTFRNAIYEGRIETYKTTLLTAEIVGLVRDSNGKIDHTPAGINSKDQSDAVCGALYNASLHAEEYAYDYGESAEQLLKLNNDEIGDWGDAHDLSLNLEEELKQMGRERLIGNSQKRVHPSDLNEKTSDY